MNTTHKNTLQSHTHHTMQPSTVKGYFVTPISIGIPVSQSISALWDTGAMPSILAESVLPLGTILDPAEVKLTGVSQKEIYVAGRATITTVLGNSLIQHTFLVVNEKAMSFPQGTKMILGADFIARNHLTIDTGKWRISRDGFHVTDMLPSVIDSKLYEPPKLMETAKQVIAQACTEPAREARNAQRKLQHGHENRAILARRDPPQGINHTSEENGAIRSSLPDRQVTPPQTHYTTDDTNTQTNSTQRRTHSTADSHRQAENMEYLVLPRASYNLKTGTTLVKIYLQSRQSEEIIRQDFKNDYMVECNIPIPGVLVTQTAIAGKNFMIYVNNTNASPITLHRDIPISSAEKLRPEEYMWHHIEISDGENFRHCHMEDEASRAIMLIYTISDVTARAHDDTGQEWDQLDKELEFDPSEMSPDPVIYDEKRFQKILEIIQPETWDIPCEYKQQLIAILRDKQQALYIKGEPLPYTHLIQHKIELTEPAAIAHTPPRWTPIKLRPFVEEEVGALLKLGLAYRTLSPYTSPIVLVRKKNIVDPQGKAKGQGHRVVVDFRRLNHITKCSFYPQRCIDELLHRLASAVFITTLDMPLAYLQVALEKLSQAYCAFSTHLGAFTFTRMAMGLKNSSYTLSMALDMALSHLRPWTENYADDIYVASEDLQSHMSHISDTLEAFIKANMVVSCSKSKFCKKQVDVLGHTLGGGYLKPHCEKTQAIQGMRPPKNRTGVRSFLGLTSFFRKFISNYAAIAKPLTDLTSESVPFIWGPAQSQAFCTLKQKLCEEPVLRAPDFKAPWYILTDASSGAIGAWLAQRHEGILHPISYHSRLLKKNELAWTLDAYECETLAIYDALKKFAPFIYGARVIILSDSRALQWLFAKAQYKSPRLTRWALNIQGVGAEILHLPGAQNRPADTLSRYPLLQADQEMTQGTQTGAHNTQQAPTHETDNTERGSTQQVDRISRLSKLMDIKDPKERDIIAQAELIIDGDPINSECIKLVKYWEESGTLHTNDKSAQINNIRENTPDIIDREDNVIWSENEIKDAQRADALLKHIINYVTQPTDLARMSVDPNIKDLEKYIIDASGILYKQQSDPQAIDTRGTEEVIVVPYSLQKRAIQFAHSSNGAVHTGPDRTKWFAHRHFYWRNMDKQIRDYVGNCPNCHIHKGRPHPKVHTRRYPLPTRPWESVSIDLIGRLPTTTNKSKFILVAVDFLTRYAVAVPLMTRSAKEVATALAKIFCEHGVPRLVLSDNGGEFRSKIMTELAKNLQFKHATIAVHHPSSQGLVERKNQAIMCAIRQLGEEKPLEWDLCLPYAILAINSAYCQSVQESPFFLYRHRDSDLPLHARTTPKTSNRSQQQFIHQELCRQRQVYDLVRERLLTAADRQCRNRDRHARSSRVQIDDRVYIRFIKNKKGQSKLCQRWTGPYRVLAQKSPSVFQLRHIVTGKQIETHIENLKIVRESEAQLNEIPQARTPLHPLADSNQENVVDSGHLPLPCPRDNSAAAVADTPPGVIAEASRRMDVPIDTPNGEISGSNVRPRRGQPRAAKKGTNERR